QRLTDRIFGHNPSVLHLPGRVRRILCQDFVEIDLKSAHLFIAASLWGAEKTRERLLTDGYSIWDDLMDHFHGRLTKSHALYRPFKGALKTATYSSIYGMEEPAI